VCLDWLAVYQTKEDVLRTAGGLAALLAIGHGKTFEQSARFSTYHSCCDGCYRHLLARRILSLLAEKICVVLVAFGIIGAVGALMFVAALMSNPTNQDKLKFVVALAVAVTGLVIGLGMPKVLRKWRTPKTLRSVGMWPYFLESSSRSSLDGGHWIH
jgi:hypothetical protein